MPIDIVTVIKQNTTILHFILFANACGCLRLLQQIVLCQFATASL